METIEEIKAQYQELEAKIQQCTDVAERNVLYVKQDALISKLSDLIDDDEVSYETPKVRVTVDKVCEFDPRGEASYNVAWDYLKNPELSFQDAINQNALDGEFFVDYDDLTIKLL